MALSDEFWGILASDNLLLESSFRGSLCILYGLSVYTACISVANQLLISVNPV